MSLVGEGMSFSEVRDLLRKWREDNARNSEDVVRLWESTVEPRQSKLGNERHLVMEQVIIAALDCTRLDLADKLITCLRKEFPRSNRVSKYKLMLLEAAEKYDEATELLEHLIKVDITNAAPRKRLVALLKAQNKIERAITELCAYLGEFMSDQEAWHELCNLYLSINEHAKAAFCMEEVLLHNPHSHLIHQRLGEIRYTMGGIDNIEIAKCYFAQAIKLNSKNLRAQYGLYLCCAQIMNSKQPLNKRKEAQKLGQVALEQAKSITKKRPQDSKLVDALESSFGAMEIKS